MKLKLIYQKNSTGDSIIDYFENFWTLLNYYKFEMNGKKYYEISVEYGKEDYTLVINDIKAIMNCLDREYSAEILTLNNINVDFSNSRPTNKSYEILIFNMSVISINQIISGKTNVSNKYINEKQIPKVCELAKKALNLLGIDFAMIKINSNGQRKLSVARINFSPVIRDKDLRKLLEELEDTIKQYGKELNHKPEVKLGADPEFVITNNRTEKMIPASEFFPKDGVVGCDNIRIPRRQQRPIGELRPQPDYSPLILHNNIKAALEQANKLVPYKNIKLLAGSQPFPGYSIGGHIHFSNLPLNSHVLRTLDNYLGLPIFLLENQRTSVKRRNKYGHLNDFRIKDYGGFEYRTPGSWLVSPEISLAVLCLAKLVSSNYLHLRRNFFLSVNAHRAFYRGDTQYFRVQFDELWQDLKRLDDYQTYSKELEIIPQMIWQNQTWDEEKDLRKTWHLNKNYSKKYTPAKGNVIAASNFSRRISNQTTTSRRSANSARPAIRASTTANYQSANQGRHIRSAQI
jgi:hypothetical protein